MKKILLTALTLVLASQFAKACIGADGRPIVGPNGEIAKCVGVSEDKTPRQVRAAHILVDNKAFADELKKKVDDGGSFEALAKKHSSCPSGQKGGDLGFFTKGQMVKPFEDAAFTLGEGKISEPVKTDFGWHLIKVYEQKY